MRDGPGATPSSLANAFRPGPSVVTYCVYQTYSADARNVGFMVFYEQLLARAPREAKDDIQTRRHDEYELAAVGGRG